MKKTKRSKIVGFLKKNPEVIMAPAGIIVASEMPESLISLSIPAAVAGIYGLAHGSIKVLSSKKLRKMI